MPSTHNLDVERFDRWAATYDQSVMQRVLLGPVHRKMLALLAQEGPEDPPSHFPFRTTLPTWVLTSLSFHHWADQKQGLEEIARVLSPGGWLCLADHTFPLVQLFSEKVKSRNQIRALLTDAGLAIRRQRMLGAPFVLLTLAQK